MINSRNVCSTLILFFLLSGCSSSPIPSSHAVNVPPDRHLSFKTPHQDAEIVIITRDTGMAGGLCSTKVYANGKLAAYVKPGEKVELHIRSKQIIIGAQPNGICGGGFVEIEAKPRNGIPSYYRISYDHSGTMGLYPTAFR